MLGNVGIRVSAGVDTLADVIMPFLANIGR